MSSPQNCHFRGDMGEPAPCQGHISPSNTQAGVGLKGVPLSPQITKSHQKGEQLFFLNVLNSDSQATDTQKRLNELSQREASPPQQLHVRNTGHSAPRNTRTLPSKVTAFLKKTETEENGTRRKQH